MKEKNVETSEDGFDDSFDEPIRSSPDPLKRLRSPNLARKFTSPLKSIGNELINEPDEAAETIRKRTSNQSTTLTPIQKKTGIPLLKRSSMSYLAEGFRTAANLADEGEDDAFGLTFRQQEASTSVEKEETLQTSPRIGTYEKVLNEEHMTTYKRLKKLNNLYQWQIECLHDKRLLEGQNCILSLPTGAGKTLIAEILMIREALIKKRSAILVLPYVAIVQEKILALSAFEDAFGIAIEEYAANKGRFPPIKRRKKLSVYVATIEKANMLINSMIAEDRIEDVGLVVVDELHMIGEGTRGAVIEQMLAKFLYKGCGQIVGMSATLPNLDELQIALRAFVYSTSFRPVALTEYVKINQTMYQVESNGDLKPSGDLPPNKMKTDPDGICQLLQKLIPKNSAVIFCPNKKNCENVALLIAKSLPPEIKEKRKDERNMFMKSMSSSADEEEKIDVTLKECMMAGVAFHHSGLTQDERKYVESAFMEGLVYVVCATSTLAAGVNLPVRRVIIKAPMVGRERLGKAQYLQMAGRAGRAGFDTKGDCITIVRPGEEERWFRQMLKSEIPKCESAIATVEMMTEFILDLIAMKIAKKREELRDVIRYTLLSIQKPDETVKEVFEKSCDKLIADGFVVVTDDGNLECTKLGEAVFNAGFAPDEAVQLNHDLRATLDKGLIFSSHFHLLFIITPYDQACNIDWDIFLSLYNALPASEKVLLGQCGLKESFILEAITSRCEQPAGSPRMRLYIALMLQKIWNHQPMWLIADRFGVDKGWLQSTVQNSIAQAASIAKFAEKMPNLWPLRLLLPELVQKLAEAAQPELIPLMAIDGVKKARASMLFNAGYKTVAAVANASEKKLAEVLGNGQKFHVRKMIRSARTIIRDQLDEKLEELNAFGIVMDAL